MVAGNYGFSGMQEFSAMARKAGICEATTDEVSNNADNDAYDQVSNPRNDVSKGLFTSSEAKKIKEQAKWSKTKRQRAKTIFAFDSTFGRCQWVLIYTEREQTRIRKKFDTSLLGANGP